MGEREDALFFWIIAGLVGAMVLFLVGVVVLLIASALHPDPPHLFCASGTELHSSPATEMVGKTPVDGVRYTCS